MKKLITFAAVCCLATLASAQTSIPPVPPGPIQNLYAVGVSGNYGATPPVAGTALYAHHLGVTDTDPGLYAFTAVDVLPTTLKPLTVTTDIGVGIAQKAFSIGNVPVYIPTAAGISFTGTNTGWQWNIGALASIHIKNNFYLMPTVRVVKSSVSNGTGYQPILGVLFGWGK